MTATKETKDFLLNKMENKEKKKKKDKWIKRKIFFNVRLKNLTNFFS